MPESSTIDLAPPQCRDGAECRVFVGQAVSAMGDTSCWSSPLRCNATPRVPTDSSLVGKRGEWRVGTNRVAREWFGGRVFCCCPVELFLLHYINQKFWGISFLRCPVGGCMVCRELAVNCKPRAHHYLLLTSTTQNDSASVSGLLPRRRHTPGVALTGTPPPKRSETRVP